MKYRALGASGISVSTLCVGTMMFGDQTDAKTAADIIASAHEHGVNFVDTADVYTVGAAETMLGPLIKAQRARWILATKVGNKMSERPNEGGYSRAWMMRAVEDSLKRLGTETIDLYYMHRDIEGLALETPVRVMGDLITSGKIRAWGLSNFRGWRIAEVMRLCDAMNVPRPAALQPYYNALNRMPEVEILPACRHYGLGVVPYSPVARGVLTGKYVPGAAPPAGTRAGRGEKRIMQTEFRAESIEIAQKVAAHAATRGLSAGQWASAWVLANKSVTSVIAGPRTLEQWQDYLPAADYVWTEEDEALIESLVAPGHPSTPGYNDPSYPFMKRRE
jgi:aryl-alcohol dehydrogenase-like predicted oxidoreductase